MANCWTKEPEKRPTFNIIASSLINSVPREPEAHRQVEIIENIYEISPEEELYNTK